jgi:hypothetical protein
MNKHICLVALVALGATTLFAQENSYVPTLGFKVGIPVTDMFSASNTTQFGNNNSVPGSSFTSAVPRYEFGVSGEFHLPKNLRFEVDGLFKRAGFDSSLPFSGGGVAYRPTTFNQWEIPGLFKVNFAMGHYRPFLDFGATYRHISTITQTTYAAGLLGGNAISNNSIALHNRNSYGGVAGIGFTFKKGPFELTPEARYTRWANQSFLAPGLRTNLDQGDVLLGIG